MNDGLVQEEDDGVASPVPIGTVVAERYRVERVIGSGGMGVVVQATHVVLQQPVAIKFLRREAMMRADAIERFVREARAAAKVQSEFVVRVQDVALLDDRTPYIVMEYVEGRDLGLELAARGPLPVGEAVTYLAQACEALIETHAAGIIHGDLKPENLYLARSSDGGRRVKLLDFGISRIAVESDRRSSRLCAGTPAYMAPEQFLDGVSDVRTEIWSLGAVLYELVSGAPPFGLEEVDDIRRKASETPLPPIERDGVPREIVALVERCMEKDPKARFRDIRELSAALRPLLPADPTSERAIRASTIVHPVERAANEASKRTAPTMLDPVRLERARRRRLHAAVGSVAAIVVVVVAAIALVERSRNARAAATLAVTAPLGGAATLAALPAPAAPAAPTATAVLPAAPASVDHLSVDEPDAGVSHPSAGAGVHVRRPARGPVADPRRASDAPPATTDRFGTRK